MKMVSRGVIKVETMKPFVEFVDVNEQYDGTEDLLCRLEFHDYKPKEGDKVSIFKVGWSHVHEYLIAEKVPVPAIWSKTENWVVFNKSKLPKDHSELYQFCYINAHNGICGASSTFRIETCLPPRLFQKTFEEVANTSTPAVIHPNEQLRKLQEENLILREALTALINEKNNVTARSNREEISELKKTTQLLKESSKKQQEEIQSLKVKLFKMESNFNILYSLNSGLREKYEEVKKLKPSIEELGTSSENILKKIEHLLEFDIGELESIPPFPFPNLS